MMSETSEKHGGLGVLQVTAGAALISFSAVFVRIGDVGSSAAGFYRMLFGGAILFTLAICRREKLWLGRVPTLFMLVCGALFSIDLWFWHHSIHLIGPGLATLLGNFQVFFMAAFGVLLHGERLGWRLAVSIPLAMIGLTMIVGINPDHLGGNFGTGVLFALITAVTYASFLLTLRNVQSREKTLSPLVAIAWVSLFSTPMMAAGSLTLGEKFVITDAGTLFAMIGYGLLCQAMGWVLISRGMPRVKTSRVGLLLLVQPVLTLLWDYLFFNKPVFPIELAGAALAMGAIYLGSMRSPERPKPTV
jgi:drug/metabolite transporter (DMT)-like permease